MAYNNFTLNAVKDLFKLKVKDAPFCETLPTAEPSPEMSAILAKWFPVAQAARTEKGGSPNL